MKHDWQIEWRGRTGKGVEMQEKQRICQNCKKVQILEAEYVWGRVRGYYWAPLAGRCKPEVKKYD